MEDFWTVVSFVVVAGLMAFPFALLVWLWEASKSR